MIKTLLVTTALAGAASLAWAHGMGGNAPANGACAGPADQAMHDRSGPGMTGQDMSAMHAMRAQHRAEMQSMHAGMGGMPGRGGMRHDDNAPMPATPPAPAER